MTDITRKLELLANLKPGDMLPAELGVPEFGWGGAISEICAEALAEIQFCRSELVRHSIRLHGCRFDKIGDNWRDAVRAVKVDCDTLGSFTELELPVSSTHPQIEHDITRVLAGQGLRIMSRPAHVAEPSSGDGVALTNIPHPVKVNWDEVFNTELAKTEREQAEKTMADAWGSPFAMNTENWR